ncbi:MAG TPA: peptidylprolyl isomerase [Gemmatimonadaceae bacterium]|nr:peptidylprolyl isomerase [Gemmatimonadaceae bacterium]
MKTSPLPLHAVIALAIAMQLADLVPSLHAQRQPLSAADSALVGRILLAEDQRDLTSETFALGARHTDARIRMLSIRASGRASDSAFAARDSLPPLPSPPVWPEPAWRLRYRALNQGRDDCSLLRAALADSAWTVRLRAAGLAPPACAADHVMMATLRGWADSLPPDVTRRRSGSVSWHAAAHGLLALSRLQPAEARSRLERFAAHSDRHLRLYAARAAANLADSATLRRLANDPDPNVRESSIASLSALTGHTDDLLFIEALQAGAPQVVRAAALALAGSPRAEARRAADAAFQRWVERGNESERDVRIALLAAAGRPASDDRAPPAIHRLPPNAVAMALGTDVRLRVAMAESSGGGSFDVRLRGDVAPMTAARILELARTGYYDGLTWHRVEHDFVVQGGSRGHNEYVGLDGYFRDELGTVPHLRGTVGMSTRGHDTGDAQWFINLKDNLRLGRDYTVFAEVVEGIDVVDAILEGDIIETITPIRDIRD